MKNILILCFFVVFAYSKSTFSDPQPSFIEPRKVVFQIFDSDEKRVNHNLSSMYNILKEYPAESLKIVVVVYGNGMRALKKDYNKDILKRVKSLMKYDVEFIGCKNTMETMNWTKEDFIDDISYAQAGIVELIEKKVDGYVGVIAY
ncbi:MAG: DsrE family protein [Campylobacterota bacterium]